MSYPCLKLIRKKGEYIKDKEYHQIIILVNDQQPNKPTVLD